jgi:two-component system cell cycle response regulator DivK
MTSRILCVEDNPQNMRLVRKILKSEGYDVIEAEDGTTGLQLAETENPALILMDVNLPDIDGLEVTRRIKGQDHLRQIPIVALTANAMFGDEERCLAAGCDGYIAKPVSKQKLLSNLNIYLDPDWQIVAAAAKEEKLSSFESASIVSELPETVSAPNANTLKEERMINFTNVASSPKTEVSSGFRSSNSSFKKSEDIARTALPEKLPDRASSSFRKPSDGVSSSFRKPSDGVSSSFKKASNEASPSLKKPSDTAQPETSQPPPKRHSFRKPETNYDEQKTTLQIDAGEDE